MMLNPGQLAANHGIHGSWGNWGHPAGAGFGPVSLAYGNGGQGFGAQGFGAQGFGAQPYGQPYGLQNLAGFHATAHGANAIDDIADDIAERVASEIADQAATGAAALFQAQIPQAGGQSLGGLNVKRWLNAARVTDTVHDAIKQNAHQLCRQAVGHLLNVLQAQWSGAGQSIGQPGGQPFGVPGQFGGVAAPGLAAYGGGQPFGLQPQNIAQLAPVVTAILGMLQSQGQGLGHGAFGQAQHGAGGRLI
jgi:hypothetical protein